MSDSALMWIVLWGAIPVTALTVKVGDILITCAARESRAASKAREAQARAKEAVHAARRAETELEMEQLRRAGDANL